jgi:cytochrome bd ubiquinol oxidase subunit II
MILIFTWAVIISLIIMMYIILDGFDLGIGILFTWIKDHHYRDIMMSSVTPIWDGNETWLVFGAAALYASFPLAYSTLLPTLYIPIAIMLAALIFRGVAFEFRFKAHKTRFIWDIAFTIGSTLAAFMQGIILGTFVTGYGSTLPIPYGAYHWFTPFNIMVGIAVICGYALLGATWLIIKTSNQLQTQMYKIAFVLLVAVTLFLGIVSIWTPLHENFIRERWFTLPNFYYLLPLPCITAILILYTFYCLKKRHEMLPFILTILLFLLAYIGFCISSWPYIVPRLMTFWDAAANPVSLKFSLIGAAILLPILMIYTVYAYRVFRGKITEVEHHY